METLIIHSEKSKIEAIKTFLKAFNVSFEEKSQETYNEEFVAKIKESEADFKAGRFQKIKTADLWK